MLLWSHLVEEKKSPQKQDNRTMLTEQCLPVAKHIATNRATARDPSISEKNVQNFHQRQRNEYNWRSFESFVLRLRMFKPKPRQSDNLNYCNMSEYKTGKCEIKITQNK